MERATAMALMLAATCNAAAQAPRSDDAIEFALASDRLPKGEVTLSNGVTVNASDWKTLIIARIPRPGASDDRAPSCTGTFVGPKAVLLAAHCVDKPLGLGTRAANLSVAGRQAELSCEIHPAYLQRDPKFMAPRGSEDYALCAVDYKGPVPEIIAGLDFEVLDLSSRLRRAAPVLMTGFGCSDLRVVDGELDWDASDRVLRVGDARIDTAAGSQTDESNYLSIRSDRGAGPAVCPGDSGGPLFTGASVRDQVGQRRIVGVNSSVASQRRSDGGYDLISRISALGTGEFGQWAKRWAAREQAKVGPVCGVTRDAGRSPCRD